MNRKISQLKMKFLRAVLGALYLSCEVFCANLNFRNYTFKEVSRVFPNIVANPMNLPIDVVIYTAFGGVNYVCNDNRTYAIANAVYVETDNGPHEELDAIPLSDLQSLEEALLDAKSEGDLAVPDDIIDRMLTEFYGILDDVYHSGCYQFC